MKPFTIIKQWLTFIEWEFLMTHLPQALAAYSSVHPLLPSLLLLLSTKSRSIYGPGFLRSLSSIKPCLRTLFYPQILILF